MPCEYFEVKKEDYSVTVRCRLLGAKYTCMDEEGCINYFVKDYCIHCIHFKPKEYFPFNYPREEEKKK